MSYQWRKFEVVEVLAGSYDHETLKYGHFLDRTRVGKTYLLLVSALKASSADEDPGEWPLRYSDQHFTGPAPPYLLTADDMLTSTDPYDYPVLEKRSRSPRRGHASQGDALGSTLARSRAADKLPGRR